MGTFTRTDPMKAEGRPRALLAVCPEQLSPGPSSCPRAGAPGGGPAPPTPPVTIPACASQTRTPGPLPRTPRHPERAINGEGY